jgi:four helix bundle protein
VLEEADETLYWLEIISETQIIEPDMLVPLITETKELVKIFTASLNTARRDA